MLRKIALALTSLLLAVALLSGLARANTRYFYCDAMGLLDSDPCAAAAAEEERASSFQNGTAEEVETSAAIHQRHKDCCEVLTLPRMPAGTTLAVPDVAPPVLTTILPLASALHMRTLLDSDDESARLDPCFMRWRSPPTSARELRAQLMVSLT